MVRSACMGMILAAARFPIFSRRAPSMPAELSVATMLFIFPASSMVTRPVPQPISRPVIPAFRETALCIAAATLRDSFTRCSFLSQSAAALSNISLVTISPYSNMHPWRHFGQTERDPEFIRISGFPLLFIPIVLFILFL